MEKIQNHNSFLLVAAARLLRSSRAAGKPRNRKGFSLVELQVAFVVFAIAMSGLCPLVVMQSKHLKKIEDRFSHSNVYYVKPSTDEWARKLGACATVQTVDPGTSPAMAILVIDDGDVGFSMEGTGWQETVSTDSYLGDYHETAAGDGSQIASWQFSELKSGWYDVRVTWLPSEEFATDAPFTVFDGSVGLGTLTVDQQTAPTGEVYADKTWQSLGIFPISGNTLKVELNNSASAKVMADGVRLVLVENDVRITSLEKSLDSEDVTAHVSVTVLVPQ